MQEDEQHTITDVARSPRLSADQTRSKKSDFQPAVWLKMSQNLIIKYSNDSACLFFHEAFTVTELLEPPFINAVMCYNTDVIQMLQWSEERNLIATLINFKISLSMQHLFHYYSQSEPEPPAFYIFSLTTAQHRNIQTWCELQEK